MPSLRDEITKTLLFISRGGRSRRPSTNKQSTQSSSSAADKALKQGHKLGPYRIVKHLGAGGMSHVYLALDTRLGRHVALKFLPPDLIADEEMLQRLEGEAQTASRLNHPNILTIYDIGQVEGEYFIASEYVDGATLRSAIERKVVNPATAIEIISQILSALVAAHSAGVIHRDLKPGNVMIRPDGYVKVIDFGLAKQVRRSKFEGNGANTITRPGSIVGTVDYMSPEQARGEPVDHRTDLWSVGVILYEILAHQRPFEGDTENHVIVNILDKPVPPITEIPDLPAGLSNVVQKALVKNPNERYQTALEMLTDLQAISRTSQIGTSAHGLVAAAKPRNRKPLMFVGLLLAGFAAFGSAWWLFDRWKQLREPDWFRVESVRRITFNEQTVEACLSPDGKYLAFAAGDSNGPQTLYLSQLSASSEEVKVPARKISYTGLSFSPDDELYVTAQGADLVGKLYRLPLIGSSMVKPILTGIDGPVSFSPSGDRFAFVCRTSSRHEGREQNESAIFVASRDGSQVRKLFSTRDRTIVRHIAWSPKGDQIAAIMFSDVGDYNTRPLLNLLDLHGVENRLPLPDWQRVGRMWWTNDARSIILSAVARTEAPNQGQLHQIALHSLHVQDITKDLAGYKSVTLTKDESRLAVIREEVKTSVWISDPGDFSHGQSAMAESERNPSVDWANEDQLILNSQRNGYPNFWLFDVGSQAHTNLTNEPFVEQDAVSVPASKSIVFSSNRTGYYKLWKFNGDTNTYTQLTFGPTHDELPSVTPDGRWIIYTSWTSNNPHLRRVSTNGGVSIQVGAFSAKWPQVSPDGKSIACLMENLENFTSMVAVVPVDGSSVLKPMPNLQAPFHWYGNQVLAGIEGQQGSNIWAVPLNGVPSYPLTHFADQKMLNFAFSPKKDRLACLRGSLESDVDLFTRRTSK